MWLFQKQLKNRLSRKLTLRKERLSLNPESPEVQFAAFESTGPSAWKLCRTA
jgi:hypothetical protein